MFSVHLNDQFSISRNVNRRKSTFTSSLSHPFPILGPRDLKKSYITLQYISSNHIYRWPKRSKIWRWFSMTFYDWGLRADVMIFNLRFRTSFVKLAIKLHPTIKMTLLVFFILNVLTFFIFDRDIDILLFVTCGQDVPLPASASFPQAPWSWEVEELWEGGIESNTDKSCFCMKIVLFHFKNFQWIWVDISSTHCCLRYLHRALEHTSANDNHEFHLLVASSQRRYYFIN